MRRVAGRIRAVGAGLLLLAAVVAAPTLSAAQEAGAGNDVAGEPVTTTPAPPAPPAPPGGGPDAPDQGSGQDQQVAGEADTAATAPQPQSAPQAKAKAAATKTVSIGDNFYSPTTITISAGDTISWKNTGATIHSATADDQSFDTGTFPGGQSRSETFTTAGTIPYYCTVHGQAQSGTIKVLAASSGGGGGGSGGGGGGGSSSSGSSEAAAVSSPGAAGSSSSLPSTGFAAATLAIVGLALLATGTLLRGLEGGRGRIRFYSIY